MQLFTVHIQKTIYRISGELFIACTELRTIYSISGVLFKVYLENLVFTVYEKNYLQYIWRAIYCKHCELFTVYIHLENLVFTVYVKNYLQYILKLFTASIANYLLYI